MTAKEPIAVIGPGRVGAPLGRRLGQAGWPILYGARHREREGLADWSPPAVPRRGSSRRRRRRGRRG